MIGEAPMIEFIHAIQTLSPAAQVAAIIGGSAVACVLIWCLTHWMR